MVLKTLFMKPLDAEKNSLHIRTIYFCASVLLNKQG
jgi:hypothetical protein